MVVVDSTGQLLPVGSGYIAVGTFKTMSDAELMRMDADRRRFVEDFTPFGVPGHFNQFDGVVEYEASIPLDPGNSFSGEPLYVLIGNTPAETREDPMTATSWFIYKSATDFGADTPLFWTEIMLSSAKLERIILGRVGDPVYQSDFGAPVPTLELVDAFENKPKRAVGAIALLVSILGLLLVAVLILRKKS